MESIISVDGKKFLIDKSILCPYCKTLITPNELFSQYYRKNQYLSITWECHNCYKNFISTAENIEPSSDEIINLTHYPIVPTDKVFEDKIINLSSKFAKIYNQAKYAEEYNLDEIAGMGYRKALEFLIKDYCSYITPNDKEQIQKMLLSQVVSKYILDNDILIFAKASVWLGNDETHYIKQFTDKDINDLKNFIDATVHYISLKLLANDAVALSVSK